MKVDCIAARRVALAPGCLAEAAVGVAYAVIGVGGAVDREDGCLCSGYHAETETEHCQNRKQNR